MSTATANAAFDPIRPLLARYGATCSAEEFQEAINVTFHDLEAAVYDELHQDMWQSLPRQYELLAADIQKTSAWKAMGEGKKLRLLDIGSGTGLSSTLMLRSALGPHISTVHLLDTSPVMLQHATEVISKFPVEIETTHGLTSDLKRDGSFDLILTCSVLHHIPDLAGFGQDVQRLQRPGGFFIHLQDPNADSATNPQRLEREAIYEQRKKPLLPPNVRRLMPDRVIPAIWRRVTGSQEVSYIGKLNQQLMQRGIIRRPMTEEDIWAVTDIHIGSGAGISVERLKAALPEFQLVSNRTYAFYGVLGSSLPADLARMEDKLIAEGSATGSYVTAAWHLPA